MIKLLSFDFRHDNLNELKRYIEIIAAQTYARCEKNPNEVSLWYILLK